MVLGSTKDKPTNAAEPVDPNAERGVPDGGGVEGGLLLKGMSKIKERIT